MTFLGVAIDEIKEEMVGTCTLMLSMPPFFGRHPPGLIELDILVNALDVAAPDATAAAAHVHGNTAQVTLDGVFLRRSSARSS